MKVLSIVLAFFSSFFVGLQFRLIVQVLDFFFSITVCSDFFFDAS